MFKKSKLSIIAILLAAVFAAGMVLSGCQVEDKDKAKARVMKEKELYKQKFQTQLDAWKADIAKLKAKASTAKADAQTKMNEDIEKIDNKIKEAGTKLEKLAETGEDAWDSTKKEMESFWESVKSAVSDTLDKFKD